MQVPVEYKEKVREAILADLENYGGSSNGYANSLGINKSVLSRLKQGETDKILSDVKWLTIGGKLGVTLKESQWKGVKTKVYKRIEQDLAKCKEHSTSKILVDDCGIGKTFSAKRIARQMKNTFYIDCSQATTKNQFIKELARTIGVGTEGTYADIFSAIKQYLNGVLEKPLVILDEAGDLEKTAFAKIKSLWNATEYNCGWYMMGADGLRTQLERGVDHKKNGFKEIYDRYAREFTKITPIGKEDRDAFRRELLTQVATVNAPNKKQIPKLINQLVANGQSLRQLRDKLTTLQ